MWTTVNTFSLFILTNPLPYKISSIMAFKFLAVFAFIACANAGLVPISDEYHSAPQIEVSHSVLAKEPEPYDPHPHYQYSYAVHDPHTGDVKNQYEFRDGDAVQGEYSLIDADGHKRTVKYTADHEHGFNAIVEREPLVHHVAPVIKEASIVHSIPTAYFHSYEH